MSNKDRKKPKIIHNDACIRELSDEEDGDYAVDLSMSVQGENPAGDELDTRGTDVTVTHPVEEQSELRHRKHITAQLAARNKDSPEASSSGAFDTAVLDSADWAFDEVGLDPDTVPVERPYLDAFLLHDAWGFDSVPALVRHLDENEAAADRIGKSELGHLSTLYRRAETLKEAGIAGDITDASERAVHTAWRKNGALPEPVMDHWELDPTVDLAEYPVSAETRREAIRNWVEVLLADATEALTFDRGANKSYSIEEYIGLFAHSALQNIGVSAAADTAVYLYDADHIPSGDGLLKHIKSDSLRLDEIEAQFAAANASVFQRCKTLGLFDDPLDLAFDTVAMTWWGNPLNATIGKRREETDATPDWVYGVLTAINKDARMCFGVNLVKSKDLHDSVLDALLETATTHATIRHVFADAEFYDGSVIEVLRKHIDDGWVVRAQETDRIKELIRAAPQDNPAIFEGVDVTSVTPSPNVFAIPKQLHRQQTLFNLNTENAAVATDDTLGTHTAYLTDLDDKSATAELINFRYDDRWSIETAMRQYQHDLHPVCSSSNVKVRVYCANIAMLFFNWHSLVNRALSPQYLLPLTVTHHELLTAIRDVAFTSAPTSEG